LPLCRTVVVVEKATDALRAPNAAAVMLASTTVDQFVAEPLMIALAMIVDEELGERTAEMPLTNRNEAVQANDVGRSPLGGMPCFLRIVAMVDRATR
jgi:hypothetical protein